MKPKTSFAVAPSDRSAAILVFPQTAGASQLAEGGHGAAEEAAGEEEAGVLGSDTSAQHGTEQAKEQEHQPGE